ncbi:MAG: hypothetical protein ACD_43C00231G0002 [uncultured bacterium]|nr:MAG: hypothetical protein ACD_43C00231G0002 [uncultured bacterium]
MKKVVIISSIIILLGGLAAVGYWYWQSQPEKILPLQQVVVDVSSKTDIFSETFCVNQYVRAEQAKQVYIPSDPQITEYLEAWNQLLLKNFSKDLIDKYFYISNAEIIDVPNKDISSEKYFEVHYYIVDEWLTLQDRAGFAIKYKNEEQIAAEDIYNYYANYKIDIPWQYSLVEMVTHNSGGSSLSDVIVNLQSGLVIQPCKEIIEIAESACPDLISKNFSDHPGAFLSFNGEKNRKKNQCGYGSVNVWTKEVSCTNSPCVIN